MKTKQSFLLSAILLLAVSFFSACTKEYDPQIPVTDPPPPNSTGAKKLSKIEYGDGSYLAIVYNAAGQVSRFTEVQKNSGGDDTYTYQLTYNGAQLKEMTVNDGTKYKYTYTGNQVTRVDLLAPNNTVIAYYEYTYVGGRLWRTDGYSSFAGTIGTVPNIRFELEYYDNGNIKKMLSYYKGYTTGVLEKTAEYAITTYDAKRNNSLLFENTPYVPLLVLVPNNPLEEKHFDQGGQQVATITHSYTYDQDGNPLTRTTVEKQTGMADEVTTTKFYY